MLRKWCLIQCGASYQYSPETRSSLPSRLMSAKTAVSEAPRSMVCFSKGISSGRLAERTGKVAHRTSRAQAAVMVMMDCFCISVFRDRGLREGCEHGVSVIPQLLHEADAGSVVAIGGEVLEGVEEGAVLGGGFA